MTVLTTTTTKVGIDYNNFKSSIKSFAETCFSAFEKAIKYVRAYAIAAVGSIVTGMGVSMMIGLTPVGMVFSIPTAIIGVAITQIGMHAITSLNNQYGCAPWLS